MSTANTPMSGVWDISTRHRGAMPPKSMNQLPGPLVASLQTDTSAVPTSYASMDSNPPSPASLYDEMLSNSSSVPAAAALSGVSQPVTSCHNTQLQPGAAVPPENFQQLQFAQYQQHQSSTRTRSGRQVKKVMVLDTVDAADLKTKRRRPSRRKSSKAHGPEFLTLVANLLAQNDQCLAYYEGDTTKFYVADAKTLTNLWRASANARSKQKNMKGNTCHSLLNYYVRKGRLMAEKKAFGSRQRNVYTFCGRSSISA